MGRASLWLAESGGHSSSKMKVVVDWAEVLVDDLGRDFAERGWVPLRVPIFVDQHWLRPGQIETAPALG